MLNGPPEIGPFWTPRMTILVLRHEGREYALNAIGGALRAKASIAYFDWSFSTRADDVEIEGRFTAPASRFIALTTTTRPADRRPASIRRSRAVN
jgi:hypothetical protein